nr:MAG TPA: hypothetical protein [Caudoviricetes sp.]
MLKNLKCSMQLALFPKGCAVAKQLLISMARVAEKCLKRLTLRRLLSQNV